MITHTQLPDAGQVPHSVLDLRAPALWRRIAQTTLTAAAAAITLAALPTGFELWRLHLYARSDHAGESDVVTMTLNHDTGANYDAITIAHAVPIDQLVTVARAASSIPVATCEAGASRAATISPAVIDFHRPTHTGWEKVGAYEGVTFGDRSAGAGLQARSGWWAWRSVAAIATITLTMTTGDFAVGSHAALWGLRLT